MSVSTPTRELCDLSAVSWTQATGMLRTKAMLLGRLSFLKGLEHMALSFCLNTAEDASLCDDTIWCAISCPGLRNITCVFLISYFLIMCEMQ